MSASDGMLYNIPPRGGPARHPIPATVPMEAVTAASRSANLFVRTIVVPVSARPPISPLRKYLVAGHGGQAAE